MWEQVWALVVLLLRLQQLQGWRLLVLCSALQYQCRLRHQAPWTKIPEPMYALPLLLLLVPLEGKHRVPSKRRENVLLHLLLRRQR